jgi:hypothetical protein
LLEAFRTHDLNSEDLSSSRFVRLRRIQALQEEGRLGPDLRWVVQRESIGSPRM